MKSNLIFHDVEQGSDKWFSIKLDKFGGTDASTFLVGSGIGKGLRTKIIKKVSDKIKGFPSQAVNTLATERGNNLEPFARKRYEMENFVDVNMVGYIQCGKYYGVSPDGLVEDDGGVEIKCPEMPGFIEWIDQTDGKSREEIVKLIPKKYFAQMQWFLFITGRQWIDYVVFNSDCPVIDYTETRVFRCEKTIELFATKSKLVTIEMDRIFSKFQACE